MPMEPIVLVSAKDMVTEKLRQEIYIGNLKPGEELVQEKISEQLGVSRMPVREALLLLESAGLIEFQKNKRAIVKSVTPESIAEHLEIRAILESHAVRKACQRAKNFDRLARIMRKFEDCGSEDEERFRDLNTRFHLKSGGWPNRRSSSGCLSSYGIRFRPLIRLTAPRIFTATWKSIQQSSTPLSDRMQTVQPTCLPDIFPEQGISSLRAFISRRTIVCLRIHKSIFFITKNRNANTFQFSLLYKPMF